MGNIFGDGVAAGGVALSAYALCDLTYIKNFLGTSLGAITDDSLTQAINGATDAIERECGGRLFKSRSHTIWLDGSGDRTLILPHYPLVSVERASIGKLDGMSVICNDAAGATEAYVDYDGTTVTLTVVGGTNDGAYTATVAVSTTLGTLATALSALTGTWTAVALSGLSAYESASIYKCGQLEAFESYAYLQIPDEGEAEYTISLEPENESVLITDGVWPKGQKNIYVEYNAGYATIPYTLQQVCAELATIMLRSGARDTGLKSEKLGDHSWTAFEGGGDLLEEGMRRRLAPFRELLP